MIGFLLPESMIASLLSLSVALKPTVFLPPMLGTQLHAEVNNLDTGLWYCANNLPDTIIWVNEDYVVPPLFSCLAEWLSSELNNGVITNRTNTSVFVTDFGGETSIDWVDTGIFGFPLVPVLVHVLETFHNNGYVIKEDMFGAPFDWRYAPVLIESFYDQLKSLIEDAYSSNGNQKVAVFGYSAGGLSLHYFMTRKVDQAWKDKYIDRLVFGSASIGGSMSATRVVWDHTYSLIPDFLNSDSLVKFVTSTFVAYSHLPNWNVFGDDPVVIGPDGTKYNASALPQLFSDHDKLVEIGKTLIELARTEFTDPQADPGVNSYIIFNSGLDTPKTLVFDDWDNPYTILMGGGDGTVSKEGMYWGCNHWGGATTVVCHDLNTTNRDFDHMGLLSQKEFLDAVYSAMTSDDCLVGGTHNVTGMDVTGWKDLKQQ
jgi:lecithin-cholesterol acyltransferase